MIHSNRLVCVAFALCLGTFLFKACETNERPGGKNRNAPAADNRSEFKPADPPLNSALIYGITIEDTDKPQKLVDTLKKIRKKTGREVYTRIVIDPERDVSDDYVKKVAKLSEAGPLMALVGDSHDVYRFNDADGERYEQRVRECFGKLRRYVKIWEIGNEVNGEWVDYPRLEKEKDDDFDKRLERDMQAKDPDEFDKLRKLVGAQILRAFNFINREGGKTALTFWYNEHLGRKCLSEAPFKEEYEMFGWIDKHVTDQFMRDNLDYVFISFYEEGCHVLSGKDGKGDDDAAVEADARGFTDSFNRLSATFKKADVGFGEFGPQCEKCRSRDDAACCVSAQPEFIERYYKKYSAKIDAPKYVGGYFYWYGLQDMVPSNKPAVTNLINAMPKP